MKDGFFLADEGRESGAIFVLGALPIDGSLHDIDYLGKYLHNCA